MERIISLIIIPYCAKIGAYYMKKKTLFLTIYFVFIIVSTCFAAYNPLADRRWQFVTNTTTNSQVYCDTQSLTLYSNGLKAWVCYYTPNPNPKKARYNMVYYGIIYSSRSVCRYSDYTNDGNGNYVDSVMRDILQIRGWEPIPPNSIVELIMNKYRR